jgi:hypothetical protein
LIFNGFWDIYDNDNPTSTENTGSLTAEVSQRQAEINCVFSKIVNILLFSFIPNWRLLMNKATLFLKLIMLFILPFTFFLLSGCASKQAEQGTEWEAWVGELTGMVDAELKLFFSRFEEKSDAYLVKGSMKGNIEEVSGGHGSGTMNAKIEGKVKDGIFNLQISGHANVSEGQALIDGKLIGTLSKTQAFGTWIINARDDERPYQFSGEWSAKKIDSESQ